MPNSSQSGDLIAVSKAKGWDPTKIWDQDKGAYGESIEGWDHDREPFSPNMGNIPGGVPAHDQGTDTSGGPAMRQQTTFNHPDTSREARVSGKPKMSISAETDRHLSPPPGDGK